MAFLPVRKRLFTSTSSTLNPACSRSDLIRKTARVLGDARNGIISVAAARDQYGVVIDPNSWQVDNAATDKLRAGRRGDAPPFVTWDDG